MATRVLVFSGSVAEDLIDLLNDMATDEQDAFVDYVDDGEDPRNHRYFRIMMMQLEIAKQDGTEFTLSGNIARIFIDNPGFEEEIGYELYFSDENMGVKREPLRLDMRRAGYDLTQHIYYLVRIPEDDSNETDEDPQTEDEEIDYDLDEHSVYRRKDWANEVLKSETKKGYADWVKEQIEDDESDNEDRDPDVL